MLRVLLLLAGLGIACLAGCTSSGQVATSEVDSADGSMEIKGDVRGRTEVGVGEVAEVGDTYPKDITVEVEVTPDVPPEPSDLTDLDAGEDSGADVEDIDLAEAGDAPDEDVELAEAGDVPGEADVCLPDCEDKECGDDGCGGSCGECQELQNLCVEGQCLCVPACFGKECGDDGCEGTCGECELNQLCQYDACACQFVGCADTCCADGELCYEGQCCAPDCTGLECGPDLCGVDCGSCGDNQVCENSACECQFVGCADTCCAEAELCYEGQCCAPDCTGLECGPDLCGVDCGSCGANQFCENNACACEYVPCADACCGELELCHVGQCCLPDCTGLECGLDLCGVDCGSCGANQVCADNVCECEFVLCEDSCCAEGEVCHAGSCCLPLCEKPDGSDKLCGDDGCGGSCGACGGLEGCVDGNCACTFVDCQGNCCQEGEVCHEDACCSPDCSGVECGGDGCGGSCGQCAALEICTEGTCFCSMLNVLLDAGKDDSFRRFIPDGDGYILAGGSYGDYGDNNYWITRVDGSGEVVDETIVPESRSVADIVPLEGGGWAVAGIGKSDYWLMEVDENLDLVWEKFYGVVYPDRCNGMVLAPDGGYVLAGETEAKLGSKASMWIIKTDSTGEIEWEHWKNWGLDRRHAYKEVLLLPDGNLMAVARSQESGYSYMVRFVKYDMQGNMLSDVLTDQKGDTSSVILASDGGYVLTAYHSPNRYIMKFDSDGVLEWKKVPAGEGMYLSGLAEMPDGGFIATGRCDGDLCLYKVTADGDVLWQRGIGGDGLDFGSAIMLQDQKLVIAGYTESFGAQEQDGWLLFTDLQGNIGCDCDNGVCDAGVFEDCNACPDDCACLPGEVCTYLGVCCTPDCDGKACGADGCYGSCGDCPEGQACDNGVCTG